MKTATRRTKKTDLRIKFGERLAQNFDEAIRSTLGTLNRLGHVALSCARSVECARCGASCVVAHDVPGLKATGFVLQGELALGEECPCEL